MRADRQHGFSLIEVLISVIVLGVMSTICWNIIGTTVKISTINNDYILANQILQRGMEEVKTTSLTHYDNLVINPNFCQFPENLGANQQACGLTDISQEYPGFTRNLQIIQNGNTLQAVITVNWIASIGSRSQQLSSFLARPGDQMPGNVLGLITDSQTGNVIANAQININVTFTQRSSGTVDANGNNYDFAANNGIFILPAGPAILEVIAAGYTPYNQQIDIQSNQSIRVDVALVPDNAVVNLRYIDTTTGNPISLGIDTYIGHSLYTRQYLDSELTASTWTTSTPVPRQIQLDNFSLDGNGIPIPKNIYFDTPARRHTSTDWIGPHEIGYGTNNACTGGLSAVGPDSRWWTDVSGDYVYNQNSAPDCSSTNKIQVISGDRINVDLPLDRLPLANVSGHVYASDGVTPATNIRIDVRWYDPDVAPPNIIPMVCAWGEWGTSSIRFLNTGNDYTIGVFPAASIAGTPGNGQVFFQVSGDVPAVTCCSDESTVRLTTTALATVTTAGLTNFDFILPAAPAFNCGNLQGTVFSTRDGIAKKPIKDNFSVVVSSLTDRTNISGGYEFACPAGSPPERMAIPEGTQTIYVNDAAFYRSNSANLKVDIVANVNKDLDLDIMPIYKSRLAVTVQDQNGAPVENATVEYFDELWQIWSSKLKTGADGMAVFSDVRESWPPHVMIDGNPVEITVPGWMPAWVPKYHNVYVTSPFTGERKFYTIKKGSSYGVIVGCANGDCQKDVLITITRPAGM